MSNQFIATLRATFEADDEVEAALMANELVEAAADIMDEGATLDVTQVIPLDLKRKIEPAELVEQLRKSRDMLILTRIIQCFELAKELDKIAWILEHRSEDSFDLAGYDYTAPYDRADELLGRKKDAKD